MNSPSEPDSKTQTAVLMSTRRKQFLPFLLINIFSVIIVHNYLDIRNYSEQFTRKKDTFLIYLVIGASSFDL